MRKVVGTSGFVFDCICAAGDLGPPIVRKSVDKFPFILFSILHTNMEDREIKQEGNKNRISNFRELRNKLKKTS